MNDSIKLVAGTDIPEGARIVLWNGVRTVKDVWPHFYAGSCTVLRLDDDTEVTVTPEESWRDRGDGVLVPVHLWMALKL